VIAAHFGILDWLAASAETPFDRAIRAECGRLGKVFRRLNEGNNL
jgi:hypothetical protein